MVNKLTPRESHNIALEVIARRLCLRIEAVQDWHKKYKVSGVDTFRRLANKGLDEELYIESVVWDKKLNFNL